MTGYTVYWRCADTDQDGEMSFPDKESAMQFTTLFATHVTVTVVKD